jgi:hypothetical protein
MKRHIFTSKVWFQVRSICWKVTCILVAFTQLLPGFVNVVDAAAAEPGIKGMWWI